MVVLTGTAAGYLESKKLSDRVRFYARLKQFLSTMETTIRYRAAPLSSLISQAAETYPALAFLPGCEKALRAGKDFPAAWQKGIAGCGKGHGLKKEDLDLLASFGQGLGVTDVEGQVAHCALYLEMAEERYSQAKEEKGKKGKLYFMLGALSGIAAALFLI